jgi:uncharacterized glyoxalase superfamily protein PhnB
MNTKPTTKIFRVTVEVASIDEAAAFYAKHFDCGGVILAVLDVAAGGLAPTPGPKSIYFAVNDIDAAHARAKGLGALAPFQVHGQPARDVIVRPWGEKSFYVTDPWGNELCFVQEGTLYT